MRLKPGVFPSAAALPVVLLAIVALLLQLGTANAMIVLDPASHPTTDAGSIMHADCASDDCSMDDCPPQQACGAAGGACHCSCAQMPPLAGAVVAFVATFPEVAPVSDLPGTAIRRLDAPFRPPA